MMAATKQSQSPISLPSITVHVVETGVTARQQAVRCAIGDNVEFSTESLESYFFARWEPVAYDALLVAAAVEFADRTKRRPSLGWLREIELRIPVHDPDLWNSKAVMEALRTLLDFLTGDRWHLEFYKRRRPEKQPRQGLLGIDASVDAVIPFSNGLASRAVAALMGQTMGKQLVRIRLGAKLQESEALARSREAFTSVPYRVQSGSQEFVEKTARSRGFKFALISGLAAYLANATRVIVPESGQGALGPSLVTVGQSYEDYRSHPLFTTRMERFLSAVLGLTPRYEFPQLWETKGQTLKKFVTECEQGPAWALTRSCWQQNRHVSVDQKRRQCGICAACMLRRMSVHAAGLVEPKEAYIWENLSALDFKAGAASSLDPNKVTSAMREYAIAGVLHLDHLAGLPQSEANAGMLNLSAFQLSDVLGMPEVEAKRNLDRLLEQHSNEWRDFIRSLGKDSFVADWALSARS